VSHQPKNIPVWNGELRGEHTGALLKLTEQLENIQGFRFIIAEYSDQITQGKIIDWLAQQYPEQRVLAAAASDNPEKDLVELAVTAPPLIHIIATQDWFSTEPIATIHSLNYQREKLAARVTAPLVLWLYSGQIAPFAHEAPDLWAWRTMVIDFTCSQESKVDQQIFRDRFDANSADKEQQMARLSAIDEYLNGKEVKTLSDVDLLLEKAEINNRIGELEAAEKVAREGLRLSRQFNDRRKMGMAYGHIANILMIRGELDEALRIRTEEELPIYQKLGDIRSSAVAQGRIADIFMERGGLNEALRIRIEEELPTFRRLGDARSTAITQGHIADILMARGELDEALRIRLEEELPTFQELGDIRSIAVTQGKIGDVRMARGELDAALRIRIEEQLPVFRELGDIRSVAVTQGRIVDILIVRGELDEALRILTEEGLPTYRKLGDVRATAMTQGKIADILVARGKLGEALRILTEELLPAFQGLGDIRSTAVTQGKIAETLMASGELDEALRIWTEEGLPTFQRLGDIREEGITLFDIAQCHHMKGETDEAFNCIRQSYTLAVKLGSQDALAVCGKFFGQMLMARGEEQQAKEVLLKSRAAFEKLGDTEKIEQIDKLLNSLLSSRE
jgi:tetratricopeptide (TPR) repeat protein